jgi:hypothetical protein
MAWTSRASVDCPHFRCTRRHHERGKYFSRGLSLVDEFGKISPWQPLQVIPPM